MLTSLRRHVTSWRARRRDRDRGESLIELLVTIVIIGLAVPALTGAVVLSIATSSQDRRQVQAQAILNTWAETIARENKSDALYTACPSLTYYSTSPFSPGTLPAGFTASVVGITYWDTASGTFVAACSPSDSGARKVQLKVSVAAGMWPNFDVAQSIVVRKLCLSC